MAFQEAPVVATTSALVAKDATIDTTNGIAVNASNQAVSAGDLVQIGLQQFSVQAAAAASTKIVPQVPWTAPQRYDVGTPIILIASKVAV